MDWLKARMTWSIIFRERITAPLSRPTRSATHPAPSVTAIFSIVRQGAGKAGLGHYHFYLPQWQQSDAKAAQCVNCHQPHTEISEDLGFMKAGQVSVYCDACHTAMSGAVR